MFYENYMQDLNYYNQNSFPNYFNPYIQMSQYSQCKQNDYNIMYPAIYRIISPVVWQVLQNTNIRTINEESLNSLVDTVYDIVEGDIGLDNKDKTNLNQVDINANREKQNINQSSNLNCKKNNRNFLLKDLIKIIFINTLINYKQRNPQIIGNCNMQQGNFM